MRSALFVFVTVMAVGHGSCPGAEPTVVNVDLTDLATPQLRTAMEQVRTHSTPVAVDLTFATVKGIGLSSLRDLEMIQSLSLFGTDVTDVELRQLGRLPSLESIDLGGCKVSTEGIVLLRPSAATIA